MIEYSIYMMGNPIKPEEPQKAYAKNQVREIWDLNKFCKHIASHNAGYSRGMVKAILSDMCDCIVEQLLNGNKIKLGEFGVFSISINCEGAESLEKFTEENIKSVNIKFNPGVDFENLVDKAEFKLVASRAGQAALLKAEKANESTVDLEAAKKKPTKDDKSDNKPSGDDGIHQTLVVEAVPTLVPTVAVMVWSRILPVTASCIMQGVVTPSNLCFTFKHISDYEEF